MHKGIHPKLMKPPKIPHVSRGRVEHAAGVKPPKLKIPRRLYIKKGESNAT